MSQKNSNYESITGSQETVLNTELTSEGKISEEISMTLDRIEEFSITNKIRFLHGLINSVNRLFIDENKKLMNKAQLANENLQVNNEQIYQIHEMLEQVSGEIKMAREVKC